MDYYVKENALDVDTYFALRASVGWNNFSREQAESALACSYTVAAYDNMQTVGMGRLIGDGMYFLVADVVVRPEYQGRGIGTEILHRIMQHIEDGMCAGSRVSVQLLSEKGKEQFYIKQGFKLVPHEYCGPALRKIIYKE